MKIVALGGLLFLTAMAHGAAADLAAGAAKAAEVCAACHGQDGVSTLAGSPSLAAQPEGFLQWQLVYFRSGTRKNELMQPIAASLSDNDIRNLAAHFAAQKPPPRGLNGAAEPAMFSVGQRLAQVHRCASCHKDDYAGEKAAARTAGQREDYLLKSLRDFKSGARTGGGVAAMADAVYPLGDEQLRALAHFMAHQP
ncbi:MAG TPA: c-type cytochrome [Burkholderiaceae bacterium]|nr:c-type cytochrome [Burkholderiaceae bacterium]